MPDENEQNALSKIKAYLDAGHSLDAIRGTGWTSWIDHLEAKGYDLHTGQLTITPPDASPPPTTRDAPPGETKGPEPPAKVSAAPAANIPTCATCGTERVGLRPYCVKCPTKWPDGTPPGRPVEMRTLFRSKWLWAVVGVGVVLVGLVILGSVIGDGGPNDEDGQSVLLDSNGKTGEPDSPGELTDTPGPMDTPEPLPTQRPANDTGSAAESSIFDDCTEFIVVVVVASEVAGQSMGEIADLATEAAMNPFTVLTSTWQSDLRAEYQRLRGARQDVASLNAPSRFQQIKALIIEGFDLFLASEEPLLEGANSFDADLIATAADFMTRGTGPITEATTLTEAMDLNDCFE